MSRKRGPVETPEYGKMVRRMIWSYARRVADADPEDLAQMVELERELRAAIQAAVDGQREQYGRSWSEIAQGVGITRSAAADRWGGPKPSLAATDRVFARCLDCGAEARQSAPDRPAVMHHADDCPNRPPRITMEVGQLLGMGSGHVGPSSR